MDYSKTTPLLLETIKALNSQTNRQYNDNCQKFELLEKLLSDQNQENDLLKNELTNLKQQMQLIQQSLVDLSNKSLVSHTQTPNQ